ncbi:MAG: SagB/ThcOx family dehydrogenase [Chitinispirillales bacterium]|jgi:SagB-type dehydrogenase family enzyme|nr:SagB/ThcOx family dehydrogenase [Chitinispirillales bacterium]
MKVRAILTAVTAALLCAGLANAQTDAALKPVQLKKPDLTRKATLMEALSKRMSTREFGAKKLSDQELSDLLWAGNGINRADKGGRTAPSARNVQDIDIYVILPEGAYLYDAKKNELTPVAAGDHRQIIAQQAFVATAPVNLLLVSDYSRFPGGANDAGTASMAALDAGTVSQNISLFCAAAGLVTVPRAMIDAEKTAAALKLKPTQKVLLNHPVGYPK